MRLDRRDLAALFAVLVPYWLLVWKWWFVVDDAYITWRYSKNVALGFGPRYNLGDQLPVEGYSDFLWMLVGAAVEAAGGRPWEVVPVISAAAGTALLVWIFAFLRARVALLPALLGAMLVGTFPPYAVWSTSGLEAMPQTLLMWAVFALLVFGDDDRDPWLAGLAGLGLGLIRTEGVAWNVVFAGIAGLVRAAQGRPVRSPLLRFAGAVAVPYAVYFAWRAAYYQSWVGNTAKAKVHMGPTTLVRGASYVALYLTTLVSPLLAPVALAGAWRGPHKHVAAAAGVMAVAVPGFAIAVSGDYMAWFRMLVPGVPFLGVVAALGLAALQTRRGPWPTAAVGLVALALGLAPGFDLYLVPESARAAVNVRDKLGFFRTENQQHQAMIKHVETWTEKGQALKLYAKPGETYVAAAIGATGYFSDLFVYDRNGLVNREVAELPWSGELRSPGHDKVVDRSFFFDKQPDILDAKVIADASSVSRIRQALRETEAYDVKDTYFPDLFEIPRQKGPQRWLIALRRAKSPEQAAKKWADLEAYVDGLRARGVKDDAPIDPTEGADDAL